MLGVEVMENVWRHEAVEILETQRPTTDTAVSQRFRMLDVAHKSGRGGSKMNLITPELMEAIIDERRRIARTIRIQREVRAVPKQSRLRRLVAGALAFVAARIHFESAQVAVGLRSAAER